MTIICPKCKTDNPDTASFCNSCAAPLKPSEDIPARTETLEAPKEELTTGSAFAGRYQIIEELGRGGMGKVFRALDKKLNEEVALKLIKLEIASDKKTLERFQNELKLARKIRHSNVGGMYELLEDKGLHYITMEYVPGEDLKSFIRRSKQLSIPTVMSIAKQICDGLSEAHKLGVVHRDLKPSNIMIDKDGNARIMDFGIARSVGGKGITGAGVMIGTPEYMSPEQVEGKEVDQRSDIYSLGVILYEMVTGQVPFGGDIPISIAHKHKYETPQEPNKINTQIPGDLNNVILKCLEKDKEQRFKSAEELRSELEDIEEGTPTTEREIPKKRPLTAKEVTVQFTLRKALFLVIGAVALVIIAIMIWRPWSRTPPVPIISDKPSLAILYFDNVSGDENLDFWREGIAELFTTDLMQSKFINVLTRDRVLSILEKLNLDNAKSYKTEDLVQVANEGRVNHTVSGSFIKAGDDILLTVVLQKPHTGEVIDSHRVTCRGEADIQPKVDELTRRIKSKLNLSQQQIESDIDRAVGRITTSSPEAFKAYLEGNTFFNRANFSLSLQFYEKAVSLDPDFAMAYRKIGSAYGNLGYRAKMLEYYKKAFELSDRMSERERYLIQGDYYRGNWRTHDKAVEAFTKLLELYPDDINGNSNLGWLYSANDEWDKSIERYEANIQNKEYTSYIAYQNVSNIYQVKGLGEKAIEVLESYLSKNPDHSRIRWALADKYLDQGKYDLALIEVDKSLSLNPTFFRSIYLKGHIFLCQGNLPRAEEQYLRFLDLDTKMDQLRGRYSLTYLNIARGTFADAEKQAKIGIALAEELEDRMFISSLYLKLAYIRLNSRRPKEALEHSERALRNAEEGGDFEQLRYSYIVKVLSLIKMGLLDDAKIIIKELKGLIDEGINKKAIRDYYYLLGQIEMEQDQFPESIEHFKQTIPLLRITGYHLPMYYEGLAQAYYRSGDLEQAEGQYKEIISLPTGRIEHGDIYAKSFYMLGKIYEQKDYKGKAIEHYEEFLDLWKDADSGVAEVNDSMERLAGLQDIH
jgi:serine/threonine protein kinase/tetratricopeptide (TPR) repeat protein